MNIGGGARSASLIKLVVELESGFVSFDLGVNNVVIGHNEVVANDKTALATNSPLVLQSLSLY